MSDRRREPVLTDFLVAMRSSIRSRSTSHNLSDESSSLSICSASADSSPFRISGRHTSDPLLDCRDRSLHRDVRPRLCSHRADPISYPFLINRFLSPSSASNHWSGRADSSVGRARIFHPVKPPNGSSGSQNSHAGHVKPETSAEDFRSELPFRPRRRATPNFFRRRSRAPRSFTTPSGGRRSAKY